MLENLLRDYDVKKILLVVVVIIVILAGAFMLMNQPKPEPAKPNIPAPVECLEAKCNLDCPQGFKVDDKGCLLCECLDKEIQKLPIEDLNNENQSETEITDLDEVINIVMNEPKLILGSKNLIMSNVQGGVGHNFLRIIKANQPFGRAPEESFIILEKGATKISSDKETDVFVGGGFSSALKNIGNLSDSAYDEENNILYAVYYLADPNPKDKVLIADYNLSNVQAEDRGVRIITNQFSDIIAAESAEGIEIDSEGNLYLLNPSDQIFKFDKNKKLVKKVDNQSFTNFNFGLASEIVERDGKIYITDVKNKSIVVLSTDLEYIGEIKNVVPDLDFVKEESGEEVAELNGKDYFVTRPAINNKGQIFVPLNGISKKISVYDSNLRKVTDIERDFFSDNMGIAVNDDYLLVVDYDLNKLHILDKENNLLKTIG